MIKKITSFFFFFYLINIITYFTIWRTITLRSFEKISKDYELVNKIENNGLNIETMKQSFLSTDKQIFNPLYNIGFYFSNWKFIPSLIISTLIVYLIFRKKRINS